jgi:signal transduction histidine kinase
MEDFRYGEPLLFEAFIKSAQYLVRLKTQQDIWDHMGRLIVTYFPADWAAFVQQDSKNGITILHYTPADEVASRRILTDEVRTLIADVLNSGFLASQVILTPAASMTAFLPILEEYQPKKIILIGHKATGPLPKELLNIYLAIAGLAGTTSERLNNERELNRHRTHLEELVKERTSQLEAANAQLRREVTERKRAEEEIIKLNETLKNKVVQLEAANKELEAFSYSVSHDLRSPLRSISGFSQSLVEDCADKLADEECMDSVRRILAATQRMGRIIDDLLNLSRVSRIEMRRERLNLGEIAKKIVDRFRKMQPNRRVEIVIAEGLVADGDEHLLTLALENLLGNAWKFTEKNPMAVIEFDVALHEGKRIYFVKDNGSGFDMAYVDKLFNPFQRLHRADEFPGTGIGLATVKRIIERHGGRVWIEGEVEKGTTAYFTL